MKNKLKIPATQLIQDLELTELEREKELLVDELSDNKVKFLNIVDEKKGWENEKVILVVKVHFLK